MVKPSRNNHYVLLSQSARSPFFRLLSLHHAFPNMSGSSPKSRCRCTFMFTGKLGCGSASVHGNSTSLILLRILRILLHGTGKARSVLHVITSVTKVKLPYRTVALNSAFNLFQTYIYLLPTPLSLLFTRLSSPFKPKY